MDKLARYALAPLVLRLGLAVVFIFHGMQKVRAGDSWGTGWNPEMPGAMQAAVAWGELLGGLAMALGFLTRLAALGLIAIMVGAIVTVQGTAHGSEIVVAAAGGASLTTVVPATAPTVSGEQKTLVLVANFSNATVGCSAASRSELRSGLRRRRDFSGPPIRRVRRLRTG